MPHKIVVLDAIHANPGDLSWEELETLGEVTIYQQTPPEKVIERSLGANILVINKVYLGPDEFDQLPDLKMVAIAATGTDNVDLKEAEKRSIVVNNAEGYSTNSVAQHAFSLILALTNRVGDHHHSVHNKEWNREKGFSYTLSPIPELKNKKLGIYGFGKIGCQAAKIGEAFGMKIYITSRHAREDDYPFYRMVDLKELFSTCDFISLHSPLHAENQGVVNEALLAQMKPSAFLINTARGGLVNEKDLVEVLNNNLIGGAGLDVLIDEPPHPENPLLQCENCIITPHMAWTSVESRKNLIRIVVENIRTFLKDT